MSVQQHTLYKTNTDVVMGQILDSQLNFFSQELKEKKNTTSTHQQQQQQI
jgi:hypothetical protein